MTLCVGFCFVVFLFVCILRPERLKHMDVEILLRHVKIIKWHVAIVSRSTFLV